MPSSSTVSILSLPEFILEEIIVFSDPFTWCLVSREFRVLSSTRFVKTTHARKRWVEAAETWGFDLQNDNVNIGLFNGFSPLFWAAEKRDIEVIKVLVKEYHADINVTQSDGLSILHLAAIDENVEMIKFLVAELGGNVNAVDICEEWAHRCVQSSRIRIWCRHEYQE
ncbi:hypothetical protein BC937DRAFT_87522, partial [Endogone sp. FLAS-F59071]